jgi:hypothetical protein
MTIVTCNQRLYVRPPIPIIPALCPTRSNEQFFLTEYDGKSLINEIQFNNGHSIETAPIRTGVKLDLMSNSNAVMLINQGLIEVSDTIDPVVYLRQIFFTVGDELFSAMTVNKRGAKAQPTLLADIRGVMFNATFDSIEIDKDTLTYFGDRPYWQPMLVNELHSAISIGFKAIGRLALSRGVLEMIIEPYLFEQTGSTAVNLSKFMTQLKNSVQVVAYTLDATFTNTYNKSY